MRPNCPFFFIHLLDIVPLLPVLVLWRQNILCRTVSAMEVQGWDGRQEVGAQWGQLEKGNSNGFPNSSCVQIVGRRMVLMNVVKYEKQLMRSI